MTASLPPLIAILNSKIKNGHLIGGNAREEEIEFNQ
jgi:hypothetical protein